MPHTRSPHLACSNLQVNNTVIDWFEPWPEQALQSVASVFLAEEVLPEDLRPQIVEHMITVHQSVRTFSARFQVGVGASGAGTVPHFLSGFLVCGVAALKMACVVGAAFQHCHAVETAVRTCPQLHTCNRIRTHACLQEELRRYNYVTPKNYLDFINNYKRALASNRKEVDDMTQRLSGGLQKLEQAALEVDAMQKDLSEAKVCSLAMSCPGCKDARMCLCTAWGVCALDQVFLRVQGAVAHLADREKCHA
eukprot:1158274-Pelagomonas_calceolata.AAC.44